ncbi:MAG TPA: efflux transporter outer membrane subunit [Terriglobales bacterium]|nr:efflux transporter outer membrane subunit [Terriglobales bacterium]
MKRLPPVVNIALMTAALLAGCSSVCTLGCTVGPGYKRPTAQVPDAWKGEGPWQTAAPKDAIPKGAWWQIFHDAELDRLEQELLQANQSLDAARDRLSQARSQARIASSAYFPALSADPSGQRERLSGNRPLSGSTVPLTPVTQNDFVVPFSVSYELDLFGRVRRNLEAANASLQRSAADLENVRLVLTAELAADYFNLRELDREAGVVRQSVEIQQRGLDLVNHRHEGGVASGLEVAQQAALLDSTATQLQLVLQQRAQFEHAIAVLTGKSASGFSLVEAPFNAAPPAIPTGVPSEILERRPDVATSERQMAFENAQVGLAMAAFYPHITLAGSGGYESRDIATLVNAPSVFWSLGGDLLQPIFNGGRNRANLASSRAAYDESVANYRESVLVAFQQVEDGLSGLALLNQAAKTQQAAVADSRLALDIANNRYVGGVTTYLDVITAQSTLLNNERLATQLLGQQMVTSVYLVKALGGAWDASEIQREQVRPALVQAVQQ